MLTHRKNSFACLSVLVALTLFLSACGPTSQSPTSAPLTPGSASNVTPAASQSAVPAANDFSKLSYSQAFDSMFKIIRRDYAFNGVAGKQPDWDAVYADIQPRILQAETEHDPQKYFIALRDFSLLFKDGNVNLGGGDTQLALFQAETEGGYGFAIRELDDGRVIVTYVTPGGPAGSAGIQVGAQVTGFNDQPISSAIEAVKLWGAPPSQESSLRYQKSRYLLRTKVGTQAKVTFANPGGKSQTVTLTAAAERESFAVTSVFLSYTAASLPVEFRILPSGVGYVRVTSTADNRDQIVVQFENALKQFKAANVPGVIIDLRVVVNLSPDTGLPALGLAGFLTAAPIQLGQLQYSNAATGKFENEGVPETILPKTDQYAFPALALLVGPGCSRSCELEAYAFSQIPGTVVVGQYPSAGVMAEATRGRFLLPEGFSFQVPTGRYVLPDGSIFLEGLGVPLTVRVPVDEATVLSKEDVILNAAEQIVLH
jgi:C-terminal processing protease CtpA/Prc